MVIVTVKMSPYLLYFLIRCFFVQVSSCRVWGTSGDDWGGIQRVPWIWCVSKASDSLDTKTSTSNEIKVLLWERERRQLTYGLSKLLAQTYVWELQHLLPLLALSFSVPAPSCEWHTHFLFYFGFDGEESLYIQKKARNTWAFKVNQQDVVIPLILRTRLRFVRLKYASSAY